MLNCKFCCAKKIIAATVWIVYMKYVMHMSRGWVLKFGFGRDVALRKLKVDPYEYQFFKKKWPVHIPIGPILGQILCKIAWFSKIFINLSQFWLKFVKNQPIHIPNSVFCKGSFIYQAADFATHVGSGSFVLSTPSPWGTCCHTSE